MSDIPRHFTSNHVYFINLFDGVTPVENVAADLSIRFLRQDDGAWLNFTNDTWDTAVVDPTLAAYKSGMEMVAAAGQVSNKYRAQLSTDAWSRGHYQAIIDYATTSEQWVQEFTVGLYQNKRLGHSLIYDATAAALDLALWVEEGGVCQDDYTELRNVSVCAATGSPITSVGEVVGSGGHFLIQDHIVTLHPNNNYLITTDAVVPVAGGGELVFPLRVGLMNPSV